MLPEEIKPYKMLSVPLYFNIEIEKYGRKIIAEAKTKSHVIPKLREELRCFFSLNSARRKYTNILNLKYEDPPVRPKLSLAITMVRVKGNPERVIKFLTRRGLKINPYISKFCVGFYSNDLKTIEDIVDALGRLNLIDCASVVNAIYYADFNKPVVLAPLIKTGYFVPSLFSRGVFSRGVFSRIDNARVDIFDTGKIKITGGIPPEHAKKITGKIYHLLKEHNAFIESESP